MRLRRTDKGFTLVELLVAMTISGILASAIGTAVSSGLFNTKTTEARLAESHGAEIAARYFSGDAASTDPTLFNSSTCGDAAKPVVSFQWTEYQSPPANSVSVQPAQQVQHVVTWALEGSPAQLVREECVDGGSASDLIMARGLSGPDLALACVDASGKNTCESTNVKTVRLTVTAPSYSYNLDGTLRLSGAPLGGTPSGAATAPLVVLGVSGTTLTVKGNPSLEVNGGVAISSTSGSPVSNQGNTSFSYSSIYVPGACPATLLNCVPNTSTSDPYAALAVSQPPPPSVPNGCGTYAGPLQINGSASGPTNTFVLNPENAPDCIYYLKQGMSITGNATVTTNTAGALIYLAGPSSGTLFDSEGTAASSFLPIQSPGSPYANIVVFADRTLDGTVLKISGTNGSIYSGTIYAPVETVDFVGNAKTATINTSYVSSVIAHDVTVAGNTCVSVGQTVTATCQ